VPELERAEPLATRGQGHADPAGDLVRFTARGLLGRENPHVARAKEPPGLSAGPLDDLVGPPRARHDGDRLDERLEEARLRLQAVLGGLVPSALRDDEEDGEGAGERNCGQEPGGREREAVDEKPDRAGRGGGTGRAD